MVVVVIPSSLLHSSLNRQRSESRWLVLGFLLLSKQLLKGAMETSLGRNSLLARPCVYAKPVSPPGVQGTLGASWSDPDVGLGLPCPGKSAGPQQQSAADRGVTESPQHDSAL